MFLHRFPGRTLTRIYKSMPSWEVTLMLGLGVMLSVPASRAQIVVGRNIQVSKERGKIPHSEVVLAADPNHVERLLACSMLKGPDKGVNSTAYVSFDGGQTWTAGPWANEPFADDPTCAYGPDGTAYFIDKTATEYPRHGSYWDALYIRKSADGGKTWELIPSILANDRPFMAIDNTNGPYRGRLYVAFQVQILAETAAGMGDDPDTVQRTNRLATSLDGGKSFRYVYDRSLFVPGHKGAAPAACATVVLSDGTVAVLHYHGVTDAPEPNVPRTGLRPHPEWLQVFLSENGGETLEPARRVIEFQSAFSLPTDNSKGLFADMAADSRAGSKYRDRLYVVWSDAGSGRATMMFSYSKDRGKTWSTPKQIGDDQKSDRPAGGPDDFRPAIAVNKNGVVGVQWYDRRDNPDNKGYFVRFTASLDGGETWLPSVRVSEAPNSVPNPLPAEGFSITGGDTAGLAADANGIFHGLWIDNRTGVQQVWTAPIKVN